MSRHPPYTRARRAIADMSGIGRVQFFHELVRDIIACPPSNWVHSESGKNFPTPQEAADALVQSIRAILREVGHE